VNKLWISIAATFLGLESPVFAHGVHLGSFHISNSSATQNPYAFVTPTGSNIDVDFLRNPNIAKDCPPTNLSPTINCNSLGSATLPLNVPKLKDMISGQETGSTFQPSQGLYQDVVTLQQTNNAFDFFEFLIPPEATTTFHSHRQGWELFYVLGGDPANDNNPLVPDNDSVIFNLNADVDGIFNLLDPNDPFSVAKDSEIEIQNVTVGKGSLVALPAGKIHTWSNTGDKPARVLALLTPSGIANGFQLAGAPSGTFDSLPVLHPFTDNCEPLSGGRFNCQVPEDPNDPIQTPSPREVNFYDLLAQAAIPGLFDQLGFNPIPFDPRGSTIGLCPVVYSAVGLQVAPSDTQIGTDCPSNLIPASSNPFDGATFTRSFSLLSFGQTAAPLNLAPLAANLFAISTGESYGLTSRNHELFRVLEGTVQFRLGNDPIRTAPEGTSIYIAPGNFFELLGSDNNGAQVIQFSVSTVPEGDLIWGFVAFALYLGWGEKRKLK